MPERDVNNYFGGVLFEGSFIRRVTIVSALSENTCEDVMHNSTTRELSDCVISSKSVVDLLLGSFLL